MSSRSLALLCAACVALALAALGPRPPLPVERSPARLQPTPRLQPPRAVPLPGGVAEVELPEPPAGEEWPFFVALFNPELQGAAKLRTHLDRLSGPEWAALEAAAAIFCQELKAGPQVWSAAQRRAQEHLRRLLGHEACNALARRDLPGR